MSAYRMPFGRYKGKPLHELPDNYLAWLYGRELRGPLRTEVDCEYERRARDTDTELVPAELVKMAEQVVSAGYRSLALKFHPDHVVDHKIMTRLNEAAEWLRRELERVG